MLRFFVKVHFKLSIRWISLLEVNEKSGKTPSISNSYRMQFNILQNYFYFTEAMKHWGYAFKEAYLRFKFKITHLIVVYYLSDEVDLSYSHTSVEPISLPPQNMITGHALPENVSRKKISTFKRNSASKGKGGSTSSRSIVDKRRSQKCAKNRRNAVQTITEILNHHLAPNVAKHKEDDEYIHSVVVTSVKDSYVFCRDMCVVCGSFGRGQEGHMVACTQCGQCYHTYCANVTLNSVIVHRGWRCLDCTVCEGCGTGDDEQHLLLCDECDVSYHMYCLDPPLDSIPQGAWRCKWCSTCQFCGATPPNGMLDSIKNLRACFKCASLYSCCFCHLQYKEEDMIILCDICHRWSHANCNGLCAEDILKKGLDAGFICVYCRPGDACSSAAMHFVIEGVLLTKSGLSTVQWRPKPAASPVCSAVYNSTRSFESLQNATADGFSELSTSQIMIQDGVVSASPDMEKLDFEFSSNSDMTIYESQNGLDSFGSVDRQKRVRNRKLFKVGIGGFHTRLARSRYDKLQEECVATASPEMMGNSLGGNAQLDNNAVAAGDSIVEEGHDKPKRRKRNRRKVVLEDYYPSYIQEAFFGISAEESSYTNGGNVNGPAPFPMSPFDLQEQDIAFAIPRSPDTEINSEVIKNAESSSQVYKLRNANVLPEVCLNEAIDMNENEEIFPHELQNHDFTNLLDMLMQADMDPIVSNTDISAIDSVEMDTLMDNVFDAELKRASELTETQLLANSAAAAAEMHQPNGRCLKDLTAICGDNAPTPFVSLPVEIGTAASQQMAPKNFNEQQTDLIGNMAGNIFPNSNNSSNSNNVNSDNMIGGGMVESTAVRPRMCESPPVEAKNYLDRWLQDEPLGDRSSIAAVLYANLNAPDLKTRYPCWPDRAKCIAKIWRSLNQDHRQQYVQMARENRSLMRQECKARRQQQQQQQQQQPCLLASSPAVRRSSSSGGQLMKLIESSSPPSMVNCAATSDTASNPMSGATPAPMPLNISVADETSHRADIPMKPHFPVIRDFFPFQQRLHNQHHPNQQHFPTHLIHHNHQPQEDQQRQLKNFTMNFSQREFFQNHDGTAGTAAQHQHQQQRKFSLPEDGLAFAVQKNDVIKQPVDHQYGMMVNSGESFRLGKAEPLDALGRRASCPSSAEALVGMAACCNNSLSSALAPAPVLSPSQAQISTREMRSPPVSWSQANRIDHHHQQQPQQQGQFGCAAQAKLLPRTPVVGDGHELMTGMRNQQGQNHSNKQQQDNKLAQVAQSVETTMHEEWLMQTVGSLEHQQKSLESELNQLRRTKKNTASKQRQMRKNGVEPPQADQAALASLTQTIGERQKLLERIRKQLKTHNSLVQDYQQQDKRVDGALSIAGGGNGQSSSYPASAQSPVPSPAYQPAVSPMDCGFAAEPSHTAPPRSEQAFMAPTAGQQRHFNFVQPMLVDHHQHLPQQQQQQPQQQQPPHYPQQQQRHYEQQHPNLHPQSALTAANFGVLAMNGASGLGAGQTVAPEPSPSAVGAEMMKPTMMNITAPPYYQRMVPVRVPLDSTVAVAPGLAPPPLPDPPLPPEFAAAHVNEGIIHYSMPGRRFAPHPLGDVAVGAAAPPPSLPVQPPPAQAAPPPPPYHHHHQQQQQAYDGIPDDETILSRTKCLNLCSMSRCYGSEVVATVKDLLDRVSDDEYGEATEAVLHMFSKIYPTDQCYDFDGSRRKGKGQLSRKRNRRSNKAKSFCGNEDAVDEMGELTDHQWFYYLQQLPPLTIVEPESRFDTAITHFYGVTPLTDCKGLVEGTLGKVTLSFAEDYYRRSCGGDGARNNSLVRMAESTTRGQIEKSFSNVKVENDFLFENRSSNSPDELIYSDGSGDEENLPCYPYLKPEMSADGRLSPNFRLVAPVPVRAVPGDPPAGALNKIINEYVQSQQSRVVTLTLDSAAASNVSNVLRNLACLLNVDVPELFDLQIDTPPHTPDRVLSREYAETQRRFCCYCATALQQAMVKKNLAELGFTPKNDDSDEVVFCSDACFVQFAVSRKMPISPGNPSKVLPNKTVITSGFENALERSNSSSMSICTANQLRIAESENSRHRLVNNVKLDEIIRSVVGTSKVYTGTSKESVVHVRDLPRLKDTVEVESENQDASHYESKIEKKLKGARWQLYNNCQKSLLKVLACNTPEALWKEMLSIFWLPQSLPQDTRICELCSRMGDGETEVCGRLLNMDAGRWVHVNCVLWSAEVYETMDGGLVNVEQAVRRASVTRCVLCDLPGATIPCYKMKCGSNFHLHCAVDSRCTFMMDKTMFCFEHPPLCRDKILYNLAVFRKVYIERDDEQLLSKLYQQSESGEYAMRIGSLLFHHVGQLLPEQLNRFHTKDCIFPVDYTVSRIYWSTFHPRRRQIYQCHIGEFEGAPLFSVTAKYPGTPEVRYQSKSINEVWQNNILTPLQGLRNCNDILKLFPSYISGESFFGLFEPSIQKMLESLPGIDSLVTYEFKYGRSLWMEPPLVLNPSGSARCEPCFRTYIKRSRKLNAMSAHSIQSLLAFSGMPSDGYFYSFGNKQSLVAKCYQYRKLKQEWKSNVYLARSKIQGLGLFANRDVEMNAMVIEYVGEVIRNEVAERREKSYQKRNRGVYMFRLDSDHVIDATVAGGPARYINHSCDPNCIAERIDFDRESRIVIMSCRPICKGEELTYDYQFDFEDELNKLPCLCRAPNCRNKEAVYMKMQTGCASCVRFTTFAEGTILALRMVSSQRKMAASFGYYTGGQHVENFAPNNACMASSPNEEFYFAVPDEQQQFVSSGPQATTYWDNSCNLNVVNPVEFQWTTDHYYPLTNWNSTPTAAAAYTHGVGNVVDEGAVPARTFIFNGQSCWNLMAEDSAIAVVKNNQIEEADEEELASADIGTVSKNRNPCRRRCAHSVIERRYRSSINERIAELKTLVIGPSARASKSTVLRAAIDKLKQLKQLNDSLRAENEQLKACCTCSPFSLSMHSLDFGQNNFDLSVSSTEELNNNSNNSSVSTNSKFTLFLLFACVVIVNPFHMVSQISTVGVAPLGKLWNAPLLKSVDISRIRAEIIENNILRILLLSVINGLVVALVIVKLRFCRRLILKDPTCPKVKSRSLTVLGDERGREDSPPPVPAPMMMRCSQFKRTFAEQLLQILLTFFHFILLPVNLFCLLSNVDDEEQKSADMGKFHYSNPTTLLHHFTDDKPHLSRFADKKRYSSIELALNSVKLAAKVDNKLEKPILVNVYCMAALQIRLLPWIGNSLAKLLYNRANQEYRKVESDLSVCWLFTPIGKKFFFNLNLNDKQFWLLKPDSISLLTWHFRQHVILNSKETEEYLNFVKHSRDEFKKKRLFGVTMSNQETDYFWYVSFILFGFGQDHRASLMDERNLLKDIQELATSAVQEACCKAAIACHLGTSSENKENIVCEILQLCMDVHQSIISLSVADYPLENITLVLAVDWCLKALIVSSEMNVHLLVNKNCTNADVNGKHMFRLLLKQKRRFISNLQPFLSRETIRYEAIGCLLDGMNPTFVQKLLMKYAKVDQFDRPWTCTNNSGGIEKWLFSLGPQQWLTSLLLSEEN
ncbi:Histone-lysine N-methyltransferase 2C [Trichinella sp. T6]|nr:Histone-lysine N-methyltransferase 2C [Trichinella sp. T6]